MAKTVSMFPDEKNEQISQLASDYADKRDRRVAATREEVSAKRALVSAMQEANLESYHDAEEGFTVTLEQGEVSVKVAKDKNADDGEGGG